MPFPQVPDVSADPRTVRVDRLIPADPKTIFEVLARPARHAELAGSGQVLGSPHGPDRLSDGARFSMRTQQARLPYRTANEVVEFEEGRRIAWQTWGVIRGRRRIGGQLWRFLLVPEGEGTRVFHEYDWFRALAPTVLRLLRYPQRSEPHMRATLERLDLLTRGSGTDAPSQ